jgi:hypothetical protein
MVEILQIRFSLEQVGLEVVEERVIMQALVVQVEMVVISVEVEVEVELL